MHCLWEIFDNAVDEALAGHCTEIEVVLHADGSAEVRDDGRGIPVDVEPKTGLTGVELVMTRLHAGGKFGGGSYTASGGLHGVGASVVNALSARLDVEVDRDGHGGRRASAAACPASSPAPGPDAAFTRRPGLRKVRRVAKRRDRHPDQVLAGPAGIRARTRGGASTPSAARPADRLPGARPGHPGPGRAAPVTHPAAGDAGLPAERRRAGAVPADPPRGGVPVRRRDQRVLRAPVARRAGHRRGAAGRAPGSSPRPCRCSTTRAT